MLTLFLVYLRTYIPVKLFTTPSLGFMIAFTSILTNTVAKELRYRPKKNQKHIPIEDWQNHLVTVKTK
jgi:hypothetical protein